MKDRYYSYVGVKGDEKTGGVYSYKYQDNMVHCIKREAMLRGFTHLALSRDCKYLYATGKSKNEKDILQGYLIDPITCSLIKNGEVVLSTTNDVCHLHVSNDGRAIVITDFVDGAVQIHAINADGSPGGLLKREALAGSSTGPRQEKTHPHAAYFTPDDCFVLAVDLGANSVFSIAWNKEKNQFATVAKWEAPAGVGPRHLAFHPNGKYVCVLTEITAEIFVLEYDKKTGILTEKQRIGTLPPLLKDYIPPTGNETLLGSDYLAAADIAFSPEGKHLYVSLRAPRTITSFAVDEAGDLTPLGYCETVGRVRSIQVSQNGAYLFGVGEESRGSIGTLEVYDIAENGQAVCNRKDAKIQNAFVGALYEKA
ncbi:MAG: lactonase family protein [Christensenellaceae bacterium]|jgi:6-phosphogluconolactonase